MKTLEILIFILCLAYYPLNSQAVPPDVEAAKNYGANGQVTLRVIDSNGKPVDKARLSVVFFPSDSSPDAIIIEGQTDTNGIFIAAGKTIHSMNYTVTQKGYYGTSGQYWFYRNGENCVQDGRWQPWNPTNTIILKESRHPVAMYAKPVNTAVPQLDSAVGYDLEAGAWVAPHGQGNKSDLLITYRSTIQDKWTFTKELSIACTNKMDGFCPMPKDMWSAFRSAYEAPTNGYQPVVNLVYDATKYKVLKVEELDRSEYIIFRVRTVLDDKGNIVSAHYGKLYGPIQYGEGKDQRLRFTYYLNPTANDRNLEFDPGRNIFPWTYTDGTRVSEP
ncbi:MAG: hypothetical protein A2340_13825 [Lentisphaerae bacterium RIFOXYB12_FULL_60_10]|nr:MAG: hypothetical protein A2340_13825 [Lentisphaerae bacterium RIFOXYB12_FULL_60_10]